MIGRGLRVLDILMKSLNNSRKEGKWFMLGGSTFTNNSQSNVRSEEFNSSPRERFQYVIPLSFSL